MKKTLKKKRIKVSRDIILAAEKTALKSDQRRSKMSAMVISNTKIPDKILRAYNYNILCGKRSIHAEEHLISRAAKYGISLKDSTIFVYRVNGIGKSKPCQKCNELLRKSGVKYVVYDEGNENYIREKLW